MTNELMTIDDQQFDAELAKMLGQDTGGEFLPLLRINTDAEDDDGNAVTPGTYCIQVDGETVYADKEKIDKDNSSISLTFRPFMQVYQYQRYDEDANDGKGAVINKTIMLPDFKKDHLDEWGGVRCGKIKVSKEEEKNLSGEQQAIQKQTSCFRIIFGTVTFTGKTGSGQTVEVVDKPCILKQRGASFMQFEGQVAKPITKAKKYLPQVETTISLERNKNGSVTYYKPTFTYDKTASRRIAQEDMELIQSFNDMIKAENDSVMQKHREALRAKEENASDEEAMAAINGADEGSEGGEEQTPWD